MGKIIWTFVCYLFRFRRYSAMFSVWIKVKELG